ncbi:MAG: septum formation initiator family protein [Pseudomonadales bacterium]
MKKLFIVACLVLIGLQYTLWFGPSGHFAQARLSQQLAERQARVAEVRHRNQLLTAEVIALKSDIRTLEARARQDLGMIKRGEVFYLVPRSE